ncbi:MAG: STAS domain-containing protein [Enhygromyxa sp.]
MSDEVATLREANQRLAAENQRLLATLTELQARQSETIRALGVPILQVWRGVLCLPVIGAVDEERANQMTEQLLERVVRTAARFAVIDLTAAEFALETAQHLARMTRCLRLIGGQAVLCGLSPKIAKLLVDMDLDFGDIPTYRDLADALEACSQPGDRFSGPVAQGS